MPTPEQEAILSRLQERYGSAAVPRVENLDSLPPEFWQQAATHLDDGSDGEPMWKRVLNTAYETPINPLGHVLPERDGRKFSSIQDIWHTIRPPLERAEEIGQLVGSPILQTLKENPAYLLPGGAQASAALGQKSPAERYVDAGRAYTGAVKGEDGLDLRGATKEATDAMELSPYVAGLAGVLFDPLNLIPGRAITAGPQAVSRIGQATRQGVKSGAAQVAEEAVQAVKGYPGALVQEGRDIEQLARATGRVAEGAAKLPAYALVGAAGGGPGRAVEDVAKIASEAIDEPPVPSPVQLDIGTFTPDPKMPQESVDLITELLQLTQRGERTIPAEFRKRIREDEYLSKLPASTESGKRGFQPASISGPGGLNPWSIISERPAGRAAPTGAPLPLPAVRQGIDRAVARLNLGYLDSRNVSGPTEDDILRMATEAGVQIGDDGTLNVNEAIQVIDKYVMSEEYVERKSRLLADSLRGMAEPTGRVPNEFLRDFFKGATRGMSSSQRPKMITQSIRRLKEDAGLKPNASVKVDDIPTFAQAIVRMGASDDANTAAHAVTEMSDQIAKQLADVATAQEAARGPGIRISVLGQDVTEDYLGMTKKTERRKLLSSAEQYADKLDTLPKTPPPPVVDRTPKVVDDIPKILEQQSVETVHAQQDPMPVDPNPAPVIDAPSQPQDAYRDFRESAEALGDEKGIQNKTPEEQQKIIEGAGEHAGDEEATRLQALVNGDIAQDTPPAPTPEPSAAGGGIGNGSGSGNVADPPSGGGGRKKRRTPKYRFGFTPVHKDIDIGGYVMPSLPDVDQALSKLRHENTWQEIADRISARFPSLVRVVNAAGTLAHAPVEAKGAIAVEVLRDRINRALAPMFAQLDRLGTEPAIFGAKDATGKVDALLTDGDEVQVFVGQIAENPSRYQLTEEQQEWLRVAQEINQAPKKILEAHGQKVDTYEHTTEFFVGRMIVGKYDSTGDVVELAYVPMADKRGLSGRAGTVKSRTFDSIEDALEAGYAPEPSYSQTLLLRARSAGREAVNIRVGHWLAQYLKQAHEGAVPGLAVVPGGNKPFRYGQQQLDVLVNTPKKGVQRFQYRLEGPEAQKLQQFAQDIAHEGELRRANKLVEFSAKVGAEIRFAVLTADLSVLAIQGLFSAAGRPIGVFKASGGAKLNEGAILGGLRALLNPDAVRRVRAKLVDDFAKNGGFTKHPNLILDYGGLSEFTEAAGGFAGRVPVIGKGVQRFGLMFDYVRDILALKHAELTEDAAKNMPDGPAKQEFIDAQDSIVNKMLGRLRTGSLGIAADQRAFESGILGLAPQYYRASFGLLSQAVEGGIRGNEARKFVARAFGTFALMLAGLTVVSGKIRGDNDKAIMGQVMRSLNPTSSEFASVVMPLPAHSDIRVGLGGMPKAMLSLLTELVVGEEALTGDEAYGGGFTSIPGRVTRAIRFGEARPAPFMGLLMDVFTKEDFIGMNTDIGTVQGLRRLVAGNTLPIFLQNAIDEFDIRDFTRSIAQTGFGVLGLNARDLGTSDVRDRVARSLYPSATYNTLTSWEKTYVKALAQPELQQLYERRAANQSDDITYANKGLQSIQYRTEREGTLLELATDSSMDSAGKYFSWLRADEFERGQQSAVSDDYSLIFGERPSELPEDEVSKAFSLWQEILGLDDEDRKSRALAAFERQFPPTSEVGQYIRRQTNQRRVPYTLLQELSNYSKSRGVIYSVYARAQELYRKVNAEAGPEAAKRQFDEYLRWAFMIPELMQIATEMAEGT